MVLYAHTPTLMNIPTKLDQINSSLEAVSSLRTMHFFAYTYVPYFFFAKSVKNGLKGNYFFIFFVDTKKMRKEQFFGVRRRKNLFLKKTEGVTLIWKSEFSTFKKWRPTSNLGMKKCRFLTFLDEGGLIFLYYNNNKKSFLTVNFFW